MKNISILLFCFLISSDLYAQLADQSKFPHKIIATSGLTIREKPTIHSKKLGNIPFNSIIYISPNDASNTIDTIEGIIGHWLPIKQNSVSGYIFSGFIEYDSNYKPYEFLVFPGGADRYEVDTLKEYFGLFPIQSDSSLFQYRIITKKELFVYFSQDPIIQINTHKSLPLAIFSGIDYLKYNAYTNGRLLHKQLLAGDTIQYELNNQKYILVGSLQGKDTIIESENVKRINNLKLRVINKTENKKKDYFDESYFLYENNHPFSPLVITWIGDLDLDGKLDIIVQKSDDKGGQYLLLLSSQAEKGHFFKQVARYVWACC